MKPTHYLIPIELAPLPYPSDDLVQTVELNGKSYLPVPIQDKPGKTKKPPSKPEKRNSTQMSLQGTDETT